jgi:chromate reductase
MKVWLISHISRLTSMVTNHRQPFTPCANCSPEYAFGVPGVLKNALDWTVSSGEFSGKPVVAISASPLWSGGDKAHASLLLTLTALGANVPEKGKLMIPTVNKKLNANGDIVDIETMQALKMVLDALARTI